MYSIPQRVTASGQTTTTATPDPALAVVSQVDQMARRASILMYVSGIGAILGAGFGVYVGMNKHR